MIVKTIYGTPIDTEAIVIPVECAALSPSIRTFSKNKLRYFMQKLEAGDRVYGLGEHIGHLNRRGKTYISYNCDNPGQNADTVSVYSSHNFLVIDGTAPLGIFADASSRVIFDVGDSQPDELIITSPEDVILYQISGENVMDILHQFLSAIGRPYIPPRWAFGYGQSRWGYPTSDHIREVARKHEENQFPLDYICLDLLHMEDHMNFTINQKTYPDFKEMTAWLKERNIHAVPIVDAGVKEKPGYSLYDSGKKQDAFCKDAEGQPFTGYVWTGKTHFPDFFRSDVREWFGKQYQFYTDMGIDGFWNDMNEPSIFFTKKSVLSLRADRLPGEDDRFQKGVRLRDYKSFYHTIGSETVVHHDVHNLYGSLMTRSSAEQLDKLLPDRYLLFSRSSYIGAHRYGGIWTGDNRSKWEDLNILVRQIPSLHMCGFLFCGSDIGGFIGNANRELLLRWLEFSVFTPLMRNHTARFTRNQECYRYPGADDFRNVLTLRYRLLPYLYSEFVKAALRAAPMIRPLVFDYPDDSKAADVEDQLLVGDSIMISPILQKGTSRREVYLPEPMLEVSCQKGKIKTARRTEGSHEIRSVPGQVIFFVRSGKLLPLARPCLNTTQLDIDSLQFLGDGTTYELYWDDGLSREITEENIRILNK